MNDRHVVVIGGGISGLAAARQIVEVRPDVRVTLLEAQDRLGGVLGSERRDGFLIEWGADNFITTPPWGVEFCQKIGFEQELLETNREHRRAFVVHEGQLREIPAGFAVMAPSRIWPIVSTPVLSVRGKLRMASELFIRRSPLDRGESLAAFVRRRFGQEVYDRLVQPLVAGIYTGDPEHLSLEATLPRFRQMEEDHGSLIRAMWRQRKAQRQATRHSSGARYSQFMAPRDGMSSLVNAAVKQLGTTEISLESPVKRLLPRAAGGWELCVGGNHPRTLTADGVLLATPAQQSAALLKDLDPEISGEFAGIQYGSCALVSLGFRREQIGSSLNGFGFVVPLVEGRQILSASFSSIKYANRAPEGFVLLRAFVGGACQSNLVELDDEQLQKLVLRELAALLAIHGEPCFGHVTRQIEAMPQYYVGHETRVRRIEQRAARWPTLALAGNALQGIGIPNCIHLGETAASRLLEQLALCQSTILE
jgi:oxygen-dependent protoporphyrinogen oxidase